MLKLHYIMVVDILSWQDTNLLHYIVHIFTSRKKRKVSQERANQSRRRRRKRPDDWREEKSLKDAGQFLGCKKVLSN